MFHLKINIEEYDKQLEKNVIKNIYNGTITGFEFGFETSSNIIISTKSFDSIYNICNKINLESNKFNELFTVKSEDKLNTIKFLTPKRMETLEKIQKIYNEFFILIYDRILYFGQIKVVNLLDSLNENKIDENSVQVETLKKTKYIKKLINELELKK